MDADTQGLFNAASTALRSLRARKLAYEIAAKRVLQCGDYIFRKEYSNTFRITCGGILHISLSYFHDRRVNGGKVDDDGDLIPTSPYNIVVESKCSCCDSVGKKAIEFTERDQVRNFIRTQLGQRGESSAKKQKDEYTLDAFCDDICESILAIEMLNHMREAYYTLQQYN
jgi:hypothetical protein